MPPECERSGQPVFDLLPAVEPEMQHEGCGAFDEEIAAVGQDVEGSVGDERRYLKALRRYPHAAVLVAERNDGAIIGRLSLVPSADISAAAGPPHGALPGAP